MKILLFLLLISCTQKYETYHVIDKQNFKKDNYEAPITKKQLASGEKSLSEYCEGQILFSSNAKVSTDRALSHLVDRACTKNRYLLNSKVTELWWTTIVYSRSCIELETYCPRN